MKNISPVDLNVKTIAIFQTNMSPGHHDEIYERNKLSFEHCSAQQYCKKPILQALSIFVNFSQPFVLYSFSCISVAVLLKCFIILKVGLVEIYNIVPLSLKYWTSIPETVTYNIWKTNTLIHLILYSYAIFGYSLGEGHLWNIRRY